MNIDRIRRGLSEERERQIRELASRRGFGEITEEVRRQLEAELDGAHQATMKLSPHTDVLKAAEDPSKRVGKYVRVALLGAGGMGEVWKAWDTSLQRWVALKSLRHDNPDELARFKREALVAASLSHPNICAVYEADDRFIAMQYIAGQTLAAFPKNDRRGAIELLRQAALAVHYAHDKGILHRDLKPANIMVEGTRAYVMDFGLARAMNLESGVSVSGMILGTPSYMSPEQTIGDFKRLDRRSDVYSLGATLYDVLAGRPPFYSANPYDIIKQVVEKDPPSLAVDADLQTIVFKCMDKDPARRYATALELAEDLQRYLNGEPILARPPSLHTKLARKIRKNPVAAGSLVLVLLAAIAGLVWGLRQSREQMIQAALQKLKEDATIVLLRVRSGMAPPQDVGRIETECTRLLDRAPGEPRVLQMRGNVRLLTDDLDGAEADFRSVLEADPDNGNALASLGTLALRRSLRLQESPTFALYFTERGATVRPAATPIAMPEARALFERALRARIDPENAVISQACLAVAEQRHRDAIPLLTRTLEGSTFFPEAFYLRGTCKLAIGEPALDDFDRAVGVGSRAACVYTHRALARAAAGDWARAIDDCSEAIRLGSAETRLNRATYYTAAGELEKAEADLAALSPEPEVRIARSHVRARQNRLDEALADLDKLDSAIAHGARGNVLLRLNRNAEAVSAFDASLAKQIAPEILNARAVAKRRGGDLSGAMADYAESIRLDPSNPYTYFNRAVVKSIQKDYAGAVEDASAAVERAEIPEAYALRGDCRVKQMDPKQLRAAVDDFEKALRLKPALEPQIGELLKLTKEQLSSYER